MITGRTSAHRLTGLVLAAALVAPLISGCNDLTESSPLADADVRRSLPNQEFSDVEMVHTDEGKVEFILHAPHLDRYDKLNKAALYGGIKIDFYKNGHPSSQLTADSGEVLKDGNELRAIGRVVVTTDTGTTIKTPRLSWTRDNGLITSDTTVTIITKYDTLHGTGLVATDDLRRRRILQPTGVSTRTVREDGTESPEAALRQQGTSTDTTDSLAQVQDTLAADTASIAIPPDSVLPDTTPAAPEPPPVKPFNPKEGENPRGGGS